MTQITKLVFQDLFTAHNLPLIGRYTRMEEYKALVKGFNAHYSPIALRNPPFLLHCMYISGQVSVPIFFIASMLRKLCYPTKPLHSIEYHQVLAK